MRRARLASRLYAGRESDFLAATSADGDCTGRPRTFGESLYRRDQPDFGSRRSPRACGEAFNLSVGLDRSFDLLIAEGLAMGELILRRAMLGATLALLAFVSPAAAEPGNDNRAPDLGDSQNLAVEEGHKVAFHTYAEGVQIWRWDGFSWVFLKPEAVLYADDGNGIVGIHYAGPTWESPSGSFVVGALLDKDTPDSSAIPWLLLKGAHSGGPGIFDGITFIQRVNTVGGIAPEEPGESVGEEARVPYAADYYFYREAR
jgi:hypothetical protein